MSEIEHPFVDLRTQDIVEVKVISIARPTNEPGRNREQDINKYLECGWIILRTWVTDYGEPYKTQETVNLLLGWSRELGQPRTPQLEKGLQIPVE